MSNEKEPPTLRGLHDALQELINKGYEMQRRFNSEMDDLHNETRAVQMQILEMLIQEQNAASKS